MSECVIWLNNLNAILRKSNQQNELSNVLWYTVDIESINVKKKIN